MGDFSIVKVIKEAEQLVDNLTPEELEKTFQRESVQIQYDRIKKWEDLRQTAEDNPSNPKKDDLIKIINLIQFVRLSILDLSVVFHQFIKDEGSEIEKKLSYRICAMMIYEITQDIPEMLGKQIRESVRNLTNNNEEIIQDLNEISKEIGKLQNDEFTKFIKDVRIISIAHKDHDSKKLLETIDSITEKEVLVLTTYIFAWNKQFENFLKKLVSKFK